MVKISDFLQQWLVVAVAALQMLKTAKKAAATQYRPTARCADAAVSIWLHAVEKKNKTRDHVDQAKKQQNCPCAAAVNLLPCSCPAPAKSLPQSPTTRVKLKQCRLGAVDCFGEVGIRHG